jgi:hypothetical protein
MTRFEQYVARNQIALTAASKLHRRKALWWSLRAIVAFVISICPVPHWLGFSLFWVTVIFGCIALNELQQSRIAKIQSGIGPYDV